MSIRISELPVTSTPDGNDLFIVNDGDVTSAVTYEDLKNAIRSSISSEDNIITGGLNVDSDTLVVNPATDRVGLHTTSPDATLHIQDPNALGFVSASTDAQADDTTKAIRVWNGSAIDTFSVSYRGQGYLSGKLGLGTETPSTKLHVKQSVDNSSDGFRLTTLGESAAYTQWISSDDTWNLGYGASATINPTVSLLTIDQSRRVGIGNTDPKLNLSVRDYGGLDGNANELLIQNNVYYDSGNKAIKAGYSHRIDLNNQSGYIRFLSTDDAATGADEAVALTESMRITNDGRLLFNNPFGAYTPGTQTTLSLYSETNNHYGLQVGGAFDLNINAGGSVTGGAGEIRLHTAASERMRINNLGNVGIGTSTLSSASRLTLLESTGNGQTLEIKAANSGGAGSQPGVKFTSNTGNNIGGIYGDTNSDTLTLQTGGADRLTINNSGNIGIKTASPSAPLHVDSDNGYGSIVLSRDGGVAGRRPFGFGISGSTDSNFRISSSSDTTGANAFANQIIDITASGKVGIGTNDPQTNFHVNGTTPTLRVSNGSSQVVELKADTGASILRTTTNHPLLFGTNDAEQMRIDSSGQVILNNSAGSSDATVLRITGGTSGSSVIEMGDTADTDSGQIAYYHSSDALGFRVNASERMRINSSGRLLIGTTTTSVHPDRLVEIGSTSRTSTYQTITTSTTGTGGILFADTTTNDTGGYRGQVTYVHVDDSMRFATSATERLRITSDGHVSLVGDSQQLLIGTNDDLQLVHDGNSRIRHVGSGDLLLQSDNDFYLQRASDGEQWLVAHEDGAVDLYHNGSKKLETKADGVSITGRVDSTSIIKSSSDSGFQSVATNGGAQYAFRAADESGNNRAIIYSNGDASFWNESSTTQSRVSAHGFTCRDNWGGASGLGNGMFSPATDTLCLASGSTERMRIDSSGNVGIGTSTVSSSSRLTLLESTGNGQTLEIKAANSGGAGSQPGIRFTASNGDNIGGIYGDTNSDTVKLQTGGTDRLAIDSSGQVDITTGIIGDNPSDSFTLNGKTQPHYGFNLAPVSSIPIGMSGYAGIAFATFGAERARISQTGQMLVGHTSPADSNNKIEISATYGGRLGFLRNDTTTVEGNNIGMLSFYGNDSSGIYQESARIAAEAAADHATGDKPGRLQFYTTNDGSSSVLERMRIDYDGAIHNNSATHCIATYTAASAGFDKYLYRGHYNTSQGTYGGTICFTVWSNGNVQNTNNSYGAISDAKLKENIVDAGSQWDDIKDIRIRNYNFIEGQTHTQLGVIAQEVETVSPGLVTEVTDTDENGDDLGTTTKSVNYSVLYLKAVKALQEAMDRIETLESKVADLEGGN